VGAGSHSSWVVNLDGASGGDGTSGSAGSSGSSGFTGSSGTSGFTGSSGSSGAQGTSGTAGGDGTSGTDGGGGTSGTAGVSDKYLGTVVAPIDYSSLVVGGAPLVVITTNNLSYSPGESVVVAYDISNYAEGKVITYNTSTGQLAITLTNIVFATSGGLTPSTSNLQGTIGATGSSGSSGASGTSGGPGSSGSSGESGTSGVGSPGSSGSAGSSGAAGTSGTSAGGSTGVYIFKLEFSAGSLVTSPFVSSQDPSGGTITSGSGGWTLSRVGATEITITHPLGRPVINLMTHAQTSSGAFMSRNISGTATQNVAFQNASGTTINIPVLTNQYTGIYGTGIAYMYITFQLPSNNIYI
jgi:hypothetical protein